MIKPLYKVHFSVLYVFHVKIYITYKYGGWQEQKEGQHKKKKNQVKIVTRCLDINVTLVTVETFTKQPL